MGRCSFCGEKGHKKPTCTKPGANKAKIFIGLGGKIQRVSHAIWKNHRYPGASKGQWQKIERSIKTKEHRAAAKEWWNRRQVGERLSYPEFVSTRIGRCEFNQFEAALQLLRDKVTTSGVKPTLMLAKKCLDDVGGYKVDLESGESCHSKCDYCCKIEKVEKIYVDSEREYFICDSCFVAEVNKCQKWDCEELVGPTETYCSTECEIGLRGGCHSPSDWVL